MLFFPSYHNIVLCHSEQKIWTRCKTPVNALYASIMHYRQRVAISLHTALLCLITKSYGGIHLKIMLIKNWSLSFCPCSIKCLKYYEYDIFIVAGECSWFAQCTAHILLHWNYFDVEQTVYHCFLLDKIHCLFTDRGFWSKV